MVRPDFSPAPPSRPFRLGRCRDSVAWIPSAPIPVWIAVSGLPEGKEAFKKFMRRVRKAVGGKDKSASGATRIAGTTNYKCKYEPDFPEVRIVDTVPGGIMTPAEGERTWPDYERCVAGAPPNQESSGQDRSMADFFWCMMAAQRGWSIDEVANKLLQVGARAQERARIHDEGYALITAQNAAAAAERGKQRGRG
jgi:hypothetical protein